MATKQEEIREGLVDRLPEIFWDGYNKWYEVGKDYPFKERAQKLLEYLHSQGLRFPNGESLIEDNPKTLDLP